MLMSSCAPFFSELMLIWRQKKRMLPNEVVAASHTTAVNPDVVSSLLCYFHLRMEYLLFLLAFCVSAVTSQRPC